MPEPGVPEEGIHANSYHGNNAKGANMTEEQLREAVARLYEDKWGLRDFWLADAAIALLRPVIRAAALEEAAKVADRAVIPMCETSADRIAAAIRALKEKPNE